MDEEHERGGNARGITSCQDLVGSVGHVNVVLVYAGHTFRRPDVPHEVTVWR